MAQEDTRLTLEDIFDANYYRLNNPDLAQLSDDEAFNHLLTYGFIEADRGFTSRLRFSPFVDFTYYQANNTDVSGLFRTQLLVNQFLNEGLFQGRTFSPVVDLDLYRASNADLNNLDNNQLLGHLIEYGVYEGRRFSPLIDLNYYQQNNPDIASFNGLQLLEHFLTTGIQDGRPFLPLFDVNFYRENNTDLQNLTNRELLDHFVNFGINDGRRFTPYFDINSYRESNPDLAVAELTNQQLFNHFQSRGLDERRRFSPFFDTNYYLANQPDLRAAGLTPRQAFDHFVNIGINEGRRPSLIFDPVYYLANNQDLARTGLTYRQALEHFETTGVRERRSASIFFVPRFIEPFILDSIENQIANPQSLPSQFKWNVPPNGVLTYSFVTTASAGSYEGPESGIRELSPQIKNNIRNMLQEYDNLLPFELVEVSDRPPNVGQLRFMSSDGPIQGSLDGNIYAYAYYPGDPNDITGNLAGDVHLTNNTSLVDYSGGPGSFGYEVILHEIGHALGLQHPFDGGNGAPVLPGGRDNNSNTVMTYNLFPGTYTGSPASTPMAYDIRALQLIYGASYFNDGDTVYRFDVNNFIGLNESNGQNGIKQTIWDGGGIDTFDFSALQSIIFGYYFDMNEGGYNTTQLALNGATYQNPFGTFTTNSFGTTIGFGFELENLIGSQGDDEILGNNFSNNIAGAAGNDTIIAARGPDVISGGSGSDIFVLAPDDGGPSLGSADIITDFTDGQDLIGLSAGLRFDRITITPGTNPNDTFIRVASTGEYLAILAGVPSFAISNGDFTLF
ncbi:M10 family metallopeptidase C-terminal domain-containing protein [Argonema antarcticum]|uniref:M10 family metallopeptidase C-terminal domain-containing protein n=1 Tax=Argonema antarcticum TaxID=2942763 RepID=UPI0020133272|nr:M10 family metallopeptidase C-terminal domain-containing protein [Argonema antarcticum]MCL1471968.1 M10 family metallopeptidase C-terminal domain-containing protein [Argonema antarcticum A004/B2]